MLTCNDTNRIDAIHTTTDLLALVQGVLCQHGGAVELTTRAANGLDQVLTLAIDILGESASALAEAEKQMVVEFKKGYQKGQAEGHYHTVTSGEEKSGVGQALYRSGYEKGALMGWNSGWLSARGTGSGRIDTAIRDEDLAIVISYLDEMAPDEMVPRLTEATADHDGAQEAQSA